MKNKIKNTRTTRALRRTRKWPTTARRKVENLFASADVTLSHARIHALVHVWRAEPIFEFASAFFGLAVTCSVAARSGVRTCTAGWQPRTIIYFQVQNVLYIYYLRRYSENKRVDFAGKSFSWWICHVSFLVFVISHEIIFKTVYTRNDLKTLILMNTLKHILRKGKILFLFFSQRLTNRVRSTIVVRVSGLIDSHVFFFFFCHNYRALVVFIDYWSLVSRKQELRRVRLATIRAPSTAGPQKPDW